MRKLTTALCRVHERRLSVPFFQKTPEDPKAVYVNQHLAGTPRGGFWNGVECILSTPPKVFGANDVTLSGRIRPNTTLKSFRSWLLRGPTLLW